MPIEVQPNKGIVVSIKANYYFVDIKNSEPNSLGIRSSITLLCTKRTKLIHKGLNINVGDNVFIEEIDLIEKKGVICNVQVRESFLTRPSVANVTNVVVMISLSEPDFNFDQASRFLITAEQTGLKNTLVLTKSDLISNVNLKEYHSKLLLWGYDAIPISIKTGQGIDLLLNRLKSSELSVLCGPSGVGKSSLINRYLPSENIPTSLVSRKLRRGRHTTRNVQLFKLSENSLLADTPGFNRPELNIEYKKLALLFPEIRIQLTHNSCKFRDCLHRDEPGCLVDKSFPRYLYYRECIEELIRLDSPFQGG